MYVREVLQSEVIPFLQGPPVAIFQQDNACRHLAKTVRDFCSAQSMEHLSWHIYSPDLSPIEHVWDFVLRHFARDPRPTASKDELLLRMQAIWNSLPQADIQNLQNTTPQCGTPVSFVIPNEMNYGSNPEAGRSTSFTSILTVVRRSSETVVERDLIIQVWQDGKFKPDEVLAYALTYPECSTRKINQHCNLSMSGLKNCKRIRRSFIMTNGSTSCTGRDTKRRCIRCNFVMNKAWFEHYHVAAHKISLVKQLLVKEFGNQVTGYGCFEDCGPHVLLSDFAVYT
ncbi:transposable element Tcb2 transposase [Trichonephila clavipes]|nr:transposable element Tcb2 transposase [Trichonephila clavipes]